MNLLIQLQKIKQDCTDEQLGTIDYDLFAERVIDLIEELENLKRQDDLWPERDSDA